MRFGIAIPHFGHLAAPEPLGQLAAAIEDLGYDSLWVSDHLVVPAGTPFLPDELTEILATAAFLAGKTTRVTIGTSVLVTPYRPAVFTAKFLSTLDVLAQGRLVVAVGVGRLEGEFDALGVPFAERWERTDEDLAVWRNLWSTDTSSFEGTWASYRDIRMFPKGHEGRPGPPIYFGGTGPRAIDRAARTAAGWHPIALGAGDVSDSVAAYRQACAQYGRGPGWVSLRYMAGYPTVDVDAWPFAGGPAGRRAAVRVFQTAEVDELVLDATMLAMSGLQAVEIVELLERFAMDVISAMPRQPAPTN